MKITRNITRTRNLYIDIYEDGELIDVEQEPTLLDLVDFVTALPRCDRDRVIQLLIEIAATDAIACAVTDARAAKRAPKRECGE